MGNLPKAIFISGTDTEVGKTVVTASLASCLKQSSKRVNIIKPFQTGTELPAKLDIEFVYKVISQGFNIEEVCPYRYLAPLAPLVAAQQESKKIDRKDIDKVIQTIQKSLAQYDITLIEGAGGLLVPIAEDYYISDLIKELNCELILVVRPNLGTINHTLLSVNFAKSKGIKINGLVISNYPEEPNLAEKTNLNLIEKFSGEKIVGLIPSLDDIDVETCKVGDLYNKSVNYFTNDFGGKLKT